MTVSLKVWQEGYASKDTSALGVTYADYQNCQVTAYAHFIKRFTTSPYVTLKFKTWLKGTEPKVVLSNEMCTVNTTSQKRKNNNNKLKELIYNNS